MATKPKTGAPEKKQPTASEASLTIEEQTQAFLKAGGKIEKIKHGVTTIKNIAGPKHLTLGKKPNSN